MKKLLVVLLTLGLVAGATLVPAAAAKKRKLNPAESTFFLHWDDDGQGGCGPSYMSTEDSIDAGQGCGFIFQPAQEVLAASGQAMLTNLWPAHDGVPLKLDGSRKITGQITIGRTVALDSHVEVTLTGTSGGRSVEIGTFTSDKVSGAVGKASFDFEMQPKKGLDKKVFSGLELATTIRGVAVLSYVDLEDPASFIVIPDLR